jgi:putative sigma-54 modulation protein
MDVTIRSHHAEVPRDLQEHAEKKLAKLERLLPRVGSVIVDVAHEETRAASDRYTVQVTVHSGASVLRAEERSADPRAAFDRASDALSTQARRHKTRLHNRHRVPGAKEAVSATVNEPAETAIEDEEETSERLLGQLVRVKHFSAKPMPADEALAQMDLLGHDFFLFIDETTDDYALVYRRRDGGYGMLSPHRS